ncbi:peptidase domain-containing ABC transporter, partial [candidate division KSB1 bacterium]
MFLGIVYTVLGLLTSIFVRLLIDKFIPDKSYIKIIYTGIFLFFLLSIRSLAGYFRQRFMIVLNKNINININKDFLSHIFKLPKKFFDTRKIGDITARINDSMRIQQAVLLITNTTIIDGLIVLGSFIF